MPEEPRTINARRVAGWAAIGGLVVVAVALYFVYGRTVPPLTAEPAAELAPAATP